MRPLKLLSLFSGIGAPERALENEGIPFELVAYCEVDKYAARLSLALHKLWRGSGLPTVITSKYQRITRR